MSPVLTSTTAETALTGHCAVVCAWCGLTLRPGDPARPASHGVCTLCASQLLDERTPLPVPFSLSPRSPRR